MDLSIYGWNEDYARALAAVCAGHCKPLAPGRVLASSRGENRVVCADGERETTLSGALLESAAVARPATGDWVALEPDTGRIRAVLPRRTCVQRKTPGRATEAQVIAANVDVLFIVMGLDGDYNPRRLERYLLLAEESGAEPAVVLNKSDLCGDLAARLDELAGLTGAPAVVMSAVEEGSAEQLHRYMKRGQTAALAGMSGAGKSTIVNALLGTARQATRGVRAGDSRGRHTTTARELFLLLEGWLLMDTPGMRELEVWSEAAPLEAVFTDIAELAPACRFRNCRHQGEPGCAVLQAIEAGLLDEDRVANYRKLSSELGAQERKRRDRILGKVQKRMYEENARGKW